MARSTNFKLLAIATVAIIAILFLIPGSPVNVNQYVPQLGSTGFSFLACNNHADNSQNCNATVNLLLQDSLPSQITSVSLEAAQGSFKYQGSPKVWSFACSGTITFGNGQSSPISASASGSGAPPSNWPVSITPKQWSLSSIYDGNYGQKNLTAQLGSKASPCSLTVSFNELPTPMKISYRYASLAKWSVNYQPSEITSTSSSTSTTISSTTSTSPPPTTGGNTVTTSQTDIWTTTITSASGGATGNTAPNGIIATLAPDFYFPSSQSVVWVYYSATAYSQCSQGIFVVVVTPSSSVSVGLLSVYSATPVGPISIPTAVGSGNPYLLQVLCADSALTMLFNQVVTAAPAQNSNLSPIQFPTTTTTTTTLSDLCAYYAQNYPNSNPPGGCPGHVGPADRLSIISVTF